MWIFGYGSLMWDGWEKKFNGTKYDKTILPNYERAFNKKSVRNWGSSENPCPTLGLEEKDNSKCVGAAFEFNDEIKMEILTFLKEREGKSFEFKKIEVILPDNRKVMAYTPVNDTNGNTYIGNISLKKRAEMARIAKGVDGCCLDYIRNIKKMLSKIGIEDTVIEELYKQIVIKQ